MQNKIRRSDHMKVLYSITTGSLIMLLAISAAFGFVLPRVEREKGTQYGFGYHYDYDNAGSSWNHERVRPHTDHRHLHDRWYYHYGRQPQYNCKQRNYASPGDGRKSNIYNRHKYNPDNDIRRRHIQFRDRIPGHRFQHTMPSHRIRIGR